MKNLVLILLISLSSFAFATSSSDCKPLTLENVELEIINKQIKHPEIVLRQAILETGWLKSYNAKVRKNLFGFWNSKRKQYFVFECWQASVAYYKNWQDRHYKGGDYYEFLERIGYATDPDYVWKLKNIKT